MQVPNRLLVGLIGNSSRPGYTQSFLDGNATLYYTGPKFPTTISLHDLHYFVPYIKGEGVRDIYEIIRIRTITGKEAKQVESEDATDDMRLAFELRFSHKLFKDHRQIDTRKMINYTFIDTTFEKMNEWVKTKYER